MTKYGSTDSMEKLAWGGTKTSTPGTVTEIQNLVTDLINLVLNRNEDFATVPTAIDSCANIVGSDILRVRNGRNELTTPQILDEIKVLLMSYMDQAPSDQSRWGNVYYT
jgi:hypothetical protein